MKKLMTLLMGTAFLAATSFAQTTPPPTAPVKAPATTAPAKKPATAPVKPATTAKPATTTHTKADGTPDKRYKENKTTAPAAGPTKKDGTPDMRYKANKPATATPAPAKKS